MTMSLLTVGTVAFDDIQTPYGHAEKVIGGACTYISWAASYFTDDIRLTSIVGADFPKDEIAQMEARGVKMDGLTVVEDGKTFFWAGKYHENMNQRDTLQTDLNVLDDFNPELPASYTDSKYIMLGNLTPDIQIRVTEQLTAPKLIVLDTMNFWMDIAMDRLKEAISKVDVLTINDEEARQLSGEYSLVKATGAGDTFAGGFMGYLTKTDDITFENMKRAVVYGSAMASFCVEEFSLGKMKDLDDEIINSRVNEFVQLTSFNI